MAAHIVTALSEVYGYTESRQFELLAHGCGYAAWGNQLELDEYTVITALCNHSNDEKCQYAVKNFITFYVMPRVNKLYEKYGYPETYEQWMERQYPKTE